MYDKIDHAQETKEGHYPVPLNTSDSARSYCGIASCVCPILLPFNESQTSSKVDREVLIEVTLTLKRKN